MRQSVFITFMLIVSVARAADKPSCSMTECAAGSAVVSYAKKGDGYFACPTMELSDYGNYVLSVMAISMIFTGHIPNISPVTGDPEQEGESKAILDGLRARAKVTTFDEAVSACKEGKNGLRLRVANNPKASLSIWVFNDKKQESFWMPKSHVDPR